MCLWINFCQPIGSDVNCPNSTDLFDVASKDDELLTDFLKSKFHTIEAKLLYLAKRVRPNILTAVSVLCSRVNAPSSCDYEYLLRIVRFLSSTIGYGLCFNGNMR